jgi:hypothetical protein
MVFKQFAFFPVLNVELFIFAVVVASKGVKNQYWNIQTCVKQLFVVDASMTPTDG